MCGTKISAFYRAPVPVLLVGQLKDNEQAIVREMIDGMVIKYEVRRLASAAS